MNERVRKYRNKLERLKGERDQTERSLKQEKKKLKKLKSHLADARKAMAVVQEVARDTQAQLEYRVSELATLALQGVLEDPYELKLMFETKGSGTQAHIMFERDGSQVRPLDSTGGGPIDIAALALQMTMWSIRRPRTRNVLILDEPMKWLKGKNMPEQGAQMLHEMSHRLGVQVLMVSHSPDLIQGADKVFEVGA